MKKFVAIGIPIAAVLTFLSLKHEKPESRTVNPAVKLEESSLTKAPDGATDQIELETKESIVDDYVRNALPGGPIDPSIFSVIAERIPDLKDDLESYKSEYTRASERLTAYRKRLSEANIHQKDGIEIGDNELEKIESEKTELLSLSKDLGRKAQLINTRINQFYDSQRG